MRYSELKAIVLLKRRLKAHGGKVWNDDSFDEGIWYADIPYPGGELNTNITYEGELMSDAVAFFNHYLDLREAHNA